MTNDTALTLEPAKPNNNKKLITCIIIFIFASCICLLILIALSITGVSTVQRNARDLERKSTLDKVVLELEQFRGNYGLYPDSTEVRFNALVPTLLEIGDSVITLAEENYPDTTKQTTSITTDYCYVSDGTDYSFIVQLESGELITAGEGELCDLSSPLF